MSYILLATLRRDLFVGGASLLEMGSIVIGRESWVAMMLLLSCCLMLLLSRCVGLLVGDEMAGK
jgi:hypothetical protein